jgi:hypothetical protein
LSPRPLAWICLAVVVAGLTGWIIGASGRSEREQARTLEARRADLAEARALMLDGRIALFQSNFGLASQRFEAAKVLVEQVQTRLRELTLAERAGRLEIVLAHLRDAQHLAAAFDPSAHTAADEAFKALQ